MKDIYAADNCAVPDNEIASAFQQNASFILYMLNLVHLFHMFFVQYFQRICPITAVKIADQIDTAKAANAQSGNGFEICQFHLLEFIINAHIVFGSKNEQN